MSLVVLRAQVAAEIGKSFSLRSSWACLATTMLAVDGLGALQVGNATTARPGDLAAGAGLALLIVMAFGAVMGTSDVQFGTIRVARLANPRRGTGYLGKVGTVAGIGGATGFAAGAVMLVIGAISGRLPTVTGPVLAATIGQGVTFFLATGAACAAGMLLQRTGLAVAAVIIWVQAIEPLTPLIPHLGPTVKPWLPFMNSLMFTNPAQFSHPSHTPGLALSYFAAFSVLLTALVGVWADHKDF